MAFELAPLPYAYDALAPYVGEETLHFHHDKHHQAYVTNLNKLIEGTDYEGKSLEDIVRDSFGKANKVGVFNNAGQVWNHDLLWKSMKKDGGGAMPGELEKRIVADFGSVDKMKEELVQAAVTQFGSGWAWLVVDNGRLKVTKTPNAETPMVHGQHALLTCDVWEHAYYIDYRNRRPDYAKAFVDNLANWEFAAQRLAEAG